MKKVLEFKEEFGIIEENKRKVTEEAIQAINSS